MVLDANSSASTGLGACARREGRPPVTAGHCGLFSMVVGRELEGNLLWRRDVAGEGGRSGTTTCSRPEMESFCVRLGMDADSCV